MYIKCQYDTGIVIITFTSYNTPLFKLVLYIITIFTQYFTFYLRTHVIERNFLLSNTDTQVNHMEVVLKLYHNYHMFCDRVCLLQLPYL